MALHVTYYKSISDQFTPTSLGQIWEVFQTMMAAAETTMIRQTVFILDVDSMGVTGS